MGDGHEGGPPAAREGPSGDDPSAPPLSPRSPRPEDAILDAPAMVGPPGHESGAAATPEPASHRETRSAPAPPESAAALDRAAEALDSALARERATGTLDPSEELKGLDAAAAEVLIEMLEDVHRLRRHRDAMGAAPTEGDLLGRYRLRSQIGRGSTSTVWRATDESIQRLVAVKILLPELGLSETQLTRFKRESMIAGSVSHAAVLALHDVGFDRGLHFLVTEYIDDGRTLADQMAEERRGLPQLANRTAARFLKQLCGGLGALHGKGIVHRDLKPANILLRPSGAPVLGDLGLATAGAKDSLMTSRSGAGTPFYRSPEQVREKKRLDARSDVFSLGVTMYELLVGTRPFDGTSTQAVNDRILHQEPIAPRSIRPELPRDLETICLRALEKDPERRYADATELEADLGRFLGHQPIEARPINAARRFGKLLRRRPVAATATASLAALMIITVISGLSLRERERQIELGSQALLASQQAVERTLATAEGALSLLSPGGSFDREQSLDLVRLMASSARDEDPLRSVSAAQQLFAASEFAMRFGHLEEAAEICLDGLERAKAARRMALPGAPQLLVEARLAYVRSLRYSYQRTEARDVAEDFIQLPVGAETPLQRCMLLLEALNAHAALQESEDVERLLEEHGDIVGQARSILAQLNGSAVPAAVTSAAVTSAAVTSDAVTPDAVTSDGVVTAAAASDAAARDVMVFGTAADRLALSQSLASYLHHRHRYTEAFDIIEATFDELRDRHGLYDYRTITAGIQLARTLNWGLLYQLRDTEWTRLKLGELLWPVALEIFGDEARPTITARWIFAEALLWAHRRDEALLNYRAVERSLGKWERHDGRILRSLTTAIAVTLNALGRMEEAEPIYQQVAAEYAQDLGAEHHDTLIPRRGLGEVWLRQGRHDEAVAEFQWQLGVQLEQRAAIGASSAAGTLRYLLFLSANRGDTEATRRWLDQLEELTEEDPELEDRWPRPWRVGMALQAEMLSCLQAGDLSAAVAAADQILSSSEEKDIRQFQLAYASAVRLSAGLDVPDLEWERPPFVLNWAILRHRGEFTASAAYAAAHASDVAADLRAYHRSGHYPSLLTQTILSRQASPDPPPLSAVEEQMVEIFAGPN